MYRAGTPVTACPRCQRALEERHVDDRDAVLACAACGGVWLDPEQTLIVFKRRRGEEAFVKGSEAIAWFSQSQRPRTDAAAICPIGGEEMVLCEASGIHIDQCREHGTWFDAHELRRIVDATDRPSALRTWLERLVGRKDDA
jgi:Zn-finger nucleic acid-binding protein